MIEEIKELYRQLHCKGDFVELLAQAFHRSSGTIQTHWINKWNIPVKNQQKVKELLDEVIQLQEKYAQEKKDLLNKK